MVAASSRRRHRCVGNRSCVNSYFPIPPKQRWLQALAFVACTVLVVIEIRAIVSDRKAANAQHAKDLAEQARSFSSLQTLLLQSQQMTLAALKVQDLPATSIKKRALDLSNEILQFLVGREVQPGYGQGLRVVRRCLEGCCVPARDC